MPTWQYAYDGQMLVEDQWTRYEYGHYLTRDVTRYGIGARGIDMIEAIRVSGPEQPNPSAPVVSYPIYDGHGNMVATLAKSSTAPYFAVGNERRFDAWGQVRTGSGGPVQKYCANLGHLQDDESSLTYMRARYYEPWTGRFISEDLAGDGKNWYSYCANNPVGLVDCSGKVGIVELIGIILDAISWASNTSSWEGAKWGMLPLVILRNSINNATDSADVEEAWGAFMKSWGDTPISKICGSDADLIATIISYAGSVGAMLAGSLLSQVLGVAGILITGAAMGGTLGTLMFGHSMRLQWYLDEIDMDR